MLRVQSVVWVPLYRGERCFRERFACKHAQEQHAGKNACEFTGHIGKREAIF